jgi:ABC-type multidrug transport system ATPase subunit
LWETLRGALAEGGAVCFATQNLEELDAFADRVIVLQDGRVEYAGPVDGYRSVALGVFG